MAGIPSMLVVPLISNSANDANMMGSVSRLLVTFLGLLACICACAILGYRFKSKIIYSCDVIALTLQLRFCLPRCTNRGVVSDFHEACNATVNAAREERRPRGR